MADPANARSLDSLATKLDLLHADVKDMKSVMRELTSAVNHLAVIEERQLQIADSLRRAFVAIELVGNRVNSLELQAVTSGKTNDWAEKILWAAAAASAMFMAKKTGLL